MALPRSGAASRAMALDLMLRTFMNSGDFQPSNAKIWDNIAKLVPGTTPQQCSQRWEELRAASQSAVVGDYTGLAAQGRPISGHGKRPKLLPPPPLPRGYLAGSEDARPRSAGVRCKSSLGGRGRSGVERALSSGQFVASFCQSVLGGGGKEVEDGTQTSVSSSVAASVSNAEPLVHHEGSSAVGEHGPSMIIHVCDEAKKMKRDFTCPRSLLVSEMRYFAEYLSSDSQLWDDVDISVHCDVPVFEWLMSYAKRGMMEGPCGEELTHPLPRPQLQPSNAVSILISSEFLKMDSLVEECLEYCRQHLSEVVASPCNMACISETLIARLAARLSPLQLEQLTDKRDKTKSRLFAYHLQQLFAAHPTLPHTCSAATLYRCKYCGCLLTAELQSRLPCTSRRLAVGRDGRVVYSHEHCPGWDATLFIVGLQQEGLSIRDIYWRVWGAVNWLECVRCRCVFQCSQLSTCAYHPQAAAGPAHLYMCCQQPSAGFTPLPHSQSGCAVRDHVCCCLPVEAASSESSLSSASDGSSAAVGPATSREAAVYATLLQMREAVCTTQVPHSEAQTHGAELSVLQREEHKARLPRELSRLSLRDGCSSELLVATSTSSSQQSQVGGASRQTIATVAKETSELEEDEVDHPPQVPQQPTRTRRSKHSHSLKQRHSRHELPLPAAAAEWIWDSKKSKRWNQDMQRESDERRLASLAGQLAGLNPTTPAAEASRDKMAVYSGGVFCRLEAQFRVQQQAVSAQSTAAQKQGVRMRTKV